MSPREDARWGDWRWQHARAARSLADVEALFPGRFALPSLDAEATAAASERYAMRATPYYLDLAERADPGDPIWALAIPSAAELVQTPEEHVDPIGDAAPGLRPSAALTRRYRDRVLLYPTALCSVHCRHCFRKRLVGRAEEMPSDAELRDAVAWIAGQPELHEVILTGGDPLTLGDDKLLALLAELDALPQIWSLRIHTRMPVVNPFRVTPELSAALARLGTPPTLVAHFNHPREVSLEAGEALERLARDGVRVLNQSVLLKGVNDDAEVLRELVWALVRRRAQPYALHHADLVPGTAHLRTDLDVHLRLQRELRGSLPGWALPRSMLDLPGGHGKVPLEPEWVARGADGAWRVRAPDGSAQLYPPSVPREARQT